MAGDNGSSNAPLRGSTRQTWEGGIREPFIISWKGRLESGKTDSRPIIQLDVMPTVLAAAGMRFESLAMIDGVNLLPYLTGNAAGRPHETLYRSHSRLALLVWSSSSALPTSWDHMRHSGVRVDAPARSTLSSCE